MEHIKDLVDAVANAKREAYASAPRDSNDTLEAAIFIAMSRALYEWYERAAAANEAQAAEPQTLAEPAADPLPPPVTEAELGPEPTPPVEEEPAKPSKRSRWKHDDD